MFIVICIWCTESGTCALFGGLAAVGGINFIRYAVLVVCVPMHLNFWGISFALLRWAYYRQRPKPEELCLSKIFLLSLVFKTLALPYIHLPRWYNSGHIIAAFHGRENEDPHLTYKLYLVNCSKLVLCTWTDWTGLLCQCCMLLIL